MRYQYQFVTFLKHTFLGMPRYRHHLQHMQKRGTEKGHPRHFRMKQGQATAMSAVIVIFSWLTTNAAGSSHLSPLEGRHNKNQNESTLLVITVSLEVSSTKYWEEKTIDYEAFCGSATCLLLRSVNLTLSSWKRTTFFVLGFGAGRVLSVLAFRALVQFQT